MNTRKSLVTIVLCLFLIGSVNAAPTYQDFTTWNEQDAGGILYQTPLTSNWNGDLRNPTNTSLYTTGVNDFVYNFELDITDIANDANLNHGMVMMWSNRTGDWEWHETNSKTAYGIMLRSSSSATKYSLSLFDTYSGNTNNTAITNNILNEATTYYITIQRIGDLFKIWVYTNSMRTITAHPDYPANITLQQDYTDTVYWHAPSSLGVGTNADSNGTISNLYTPQYQYVFTRSYYENGTINLNPISVTVSSPNGTGTFDVNQTTQEKSYGYEPEAYYWDIGTGLTRYIYSIGSETLYVTYPESTAYSYGFTIKDYTGKLGLGTAYLEAYRSLNGTERLIERQKITQPNPTPLNLVYGRTYHLKILFADGSRYDWGYFLAGSDTTNTILIRDLEWTDQIHSIYGIIQVEATRATNGQTITIQYNDTRENTVWANVTIRERNNGIVLNAARNNDTYILNWASANASLGYVVSISGDHSDFGEWGHVWIFDEDEGFPDAPSLDGIWDFGLGANLGGWLLVMASVLGFSKTLKARALIVGIVVATLTNYIGFSAWTGNQLIFGWFFAVVVALASGGGE